MCRCCYIKGATVDFMEDISVVTGEKENKKVHETAKWQSCVSFRFRGRREGYVRYFYGMLWTFLL